MSGLIIKSETYLRSESKAFFEHYVGNYSYSTSQTLCFPPFFCLALAFNVAAINHNKIFEAQRSSLRNPTKREYSIGIPEHHANREASLPLASTVQRGNFPQADVPKAASPGTNL